MFRPTIPTNPTPTGAVIPLDTRSTVSQEVSEVTVTTPVPAAPAPSRPVVQLTPGALVALVGGGTAVVLVVGAVLVSMLLAVAVTAASVAVCAVVLRSLMTSYNRR
ncbi:SpdD-like protein [Actinacidiphila glaucinigra]|uniref:SpdD-like protein n=1 Tax=Actinacidiphila glaucinigra TaxID=235986 RepID=UPI002DD7EBA1|nr:SpdD-like protein [Actinacidiphila glaucinigra]WSD62363.1 SpdD-like protein [Actinacidiphila glaucinigra]